MLSVLARARTAASAVPAPAVAAAFTRACSMVTSLNATHKLPPIRNEPFKHYAKGSAERADIDAACRQARAEVVEIPCVVNGREVLTGNVREQTMASDHGHVIARYHYASEELVQEAIAGTLEAKAQWHRLPFAHRAAIFLRAADILALQRRSEVMAATMLGQGKTVWQAEVDAAVELVDFWRFAVKYADEIRRTQPPEHAAGEWNIMDWRPLDGFVAAISPFNFTAIGGNLAGAPALVGNGVVWKPADTAMLASWRVFQILREAGLPDGVVQFLPCDGPTFGDAVTQHPDLGGIHFTGSTATFARLNQDVARNLPQLNQYPRIVGETGGKDFHFLHPSATVDHAVQATLRGAFEYQGQKCSATSRVYCPRSLWDDFSSRLVEETAQLTMGQPDDFTSFMSAVIDQNSFQKCHRYIEAARADASCTVLTGGRCDDSVGWFVEPTIIHTTNPGYAAMVEEIFGPILTCYVYEDDQFEETMRLCSQSTKYALTGSIFAGDRDAVALALDRFRFSAGNFYINDKCTGSMVGQQPFGGSGLSGTNDKSGSFLNLLRWHSPRSVKENLVFKGRHDWGYPSVDPK